MTIELLYQIFSSEYFQKLFGPEFIRFAIFAIPFIMVVGKHFKEMKDEVKHARTDMKEELSNVRHEIHEFKDIFKAQNRSMDKRTGEVEARVEALDFRVYDLEIRFKGKEAQNGKSI